MTGGIFGLAMSILLIVAIWKMFKKAGVPGWHSIIPFLNTYDLVKLAWNKRMAGIYLIVTFIYGFFAGIVIEANKEGREVPIFASLAVLVLSIVVLVIYVRLMHRLSKSFGHGIGFTLGLIFLGGIFMLILGFGSSRYIGPEGVPVYTGYAAPYMGDPNQQYPQYPQYQQNPQYPQYPQYQQPQGNPFDNGNPYQ